MSVKVTCPNCGLEREVAENLLGSRAKCRNCQTIFPLTDGASSSLATVGEMVPTSLETSAPLEPSPMFAEPAVGPVVAASTARTPKPPPSPPPSRAQQCPLCNGRFRVPTNAIGQVVSCPHCREALLAGEDGARPVEAPPADESDLDLVETPPVSLASASRPLIPGEDGTQERVEDFVKFLNARRTARPVPSPEDDTTPVAPTAESRRTRYGGPATPAAAVDADVVLRPFFFPEDPQVGPIFTEKLRDVLAKEGAPFGKVVISESDLAFGRLATVEDTGSNALISRPGLLRNGNVRIEVGAMVHQPEGDSEPIQARARRMVRRGLAASLQMKSIIKGTTKSAATRTANEILRVTTGARHARTEISSFATVACIFGCLALFPAVGFVLYAIGVICGILVFTYNRGRERKVGFKRTLIGLIVGGLATLLWSIVIFFPNR